MIASPGARELAVEALVLAPSGEVYQFGAIRVDLRRTEVLRNGRLMVDKFDIEKHGFRFVHTRPKLPISTTRTKCTGSITRKWRR